MLVKPTLEKFLKYCYVKFDTDQQLRDALKKSENFGDLSQIHLTPTLPPYFGTKKFGTLCTKSGPPPSFMKLGQKGPKNWFIKA